MRTGRLRDSSRGLSTSKLPLSIVMVVGLALGLVGFVGLVGSAEAGGDAELFSATGGAPPNILILLDSSGSMGKAPANCDGCDIKRVMANKAIHSLVTAVNPPDGSGGYINNARLGFAIFTKNGARLLVPVADDTVPDIVSWVTEPTIADAADNLNSLGGNSHGLAIMEMGRYFAHEGQWGPFPPWGFSNDDYAGKPYTGNADPSDYEFESYETPPIWDLACRPSFLIHVDDGLWKGDDGDRFGTCSDLNENGSDETCALEYIGDMSGDGEFWMEDITQKLFEEDFSDLPGKQNVVTYVIGFDEPLAADLMRIAAENGGGSFFFATNEEELTKALLAITVNIFESIASFAGVAVPSSRSSSGAALYNAWFEPRNDQSIWAGHLEAYGLSSEGDILDKTGALATDSSGLLVEPHNPYWDVAVGLASNTSRVIYTTDSNGYQVILNTSNISADDLVLSPDPVGEPDPEPDPSPDPEPEPEPDVCVAQPAELLSGWDFQLIDPVTLPDVLVDGNIRFKYCVPPTRKGIDNDYYGTYPIDGTGTDEIDLHKRKSKDAICSYDGAGNVTGGHKEKDLVVGKQEGIVHVRYYLENDFSPGGLAGFSASVCVSFDGGSTEEGGGGETPPPPLAVADPDFAPYPNASSSGIDTYAELQAAVIDFAYGIDAFDQDEDGSKTDLRDVVFGDVFHSTPLVVGLPRLFLAGEDGFSDFYDSYNTRDRILYVGANDGMLHGFHAGDYHADDPDTPGTNEGDDSSTAVEEHGYYDQGTGEEVFGYVPAMLLPKLKLLSHNIPRSDYFVDASPIAADSWLGDGSSYDVTKSGDEWATVLITGLREGGSGYTALDITDPTATSSDAHGPFPKLLWEFTDPNLGESWSKPVIARIKVRASSGGDHCGRDDTDGDCHEVWVAIFGGGYLPAADPNHFTWEGDPNESGWTDQSKGVYMVNLATGSLMAAIEFDASDSILDDMKYAFPSSPGVFDVDADGFSDVIYIGDLGGQMWKWDIHTPGEDTDSDGLLDWPAGVFFESEPVTFDSGTVHYRSIFTSPAATFLKGDLLISFGTGESEDLRYEGNEDEDDENRIYVITDDAPRGGLPASTLTEADFTADSDVTNSSTDNDPDDIGFFYRAAEGEKFVTDVTIFAGSVIVATYTPNVGDDLCVTSGGQAFVHIFDIATGEGFFPANPLISDPPNDRRYLIGGGLPSSPTISIADDPADDRLFIKTSTGLIVSPDHDEREDDNGTFIYWRQKF